MIALSVGFRPLPDSTPKGPVVVHTPATLARELKAEAQQPPELDERVAHAVGKLAPVSG